MISNKSRILSDAVTGIVNTDLPPIPNGNKWVISRIGATDVSKSAKPSIYRLYFGGFLLRAICLTTGTYQIEMNVELTGDGVKFVRIQRENTESGAKEMPFWMDAYER